MYHDYCLIAIPIFNANSLDPDKTPHSAVSDLGLDCKCPIYGMPSINGLRYLLSGRMPHYCHQRAVSIKYRYADN